MPREFSFVAGAALEALRSGRLPYHRDLQGHFTAYCLLTTDLQKLFEYIEPRTDNLQCYSHRTYELLVRASTEVESLFKLIFRVIGLPTNKTTIIQYGMIGRDLGLQVYRMSVAGHALLPLHPFASFASTDRERVSPPWYKAYNDVKHNRNEAFHQATLENVLGAVAGVAILVRCCMRQSLLPAPFPKNVLRFDHDLLMPASLAPASSADHMSE